MKNIVVLNGDALTRDAAKKALHDAGYHVMLAAGEAEAVAMLQSTPIDLILLIMPLQSEPGWSVCRNLVRGFSAVPLVVITAQPGQFQTALAAGASALLERPVAMRHLLHVAQELMVKRVEPDPYRSGGIFYYIAANT